MSGTRSVSLKLAFWKESKRLFLFSGAVQRSLDVLRCRLLASDRVESFSIENDGSVYILCTCMLITGSLFAYLLALIFEPSKFNAFFGRFLIFAIRKLDLGHFLIFSFFFILFTPLLLFECRCNRCAYSKYLKYNISLYVYLCFR